MADKVNMSLDEIIKASKNRRDTEASGSRKSFPKKQVGVWIEITVRLEVSSQLWSAVLQPDRLRALTLTLHIAGRSIEHWTW